MATKKKTADKALEIMRPHMQQVIIVTTTPEEMNEEVNKLLEHFDLYNVSNSTMNTNGRVQFIAYLYGRYRDEEDAPTKGFY